MYVRTKKGRDHYGDPILRKRTRLRDVETMVTEATFAATAGI